MTQGNNGLKPFVWIMGTETKKTRTGREENPINEKKVLFEIKQENPSVNIASNYGWNVVD